ncbi:hypothetical protein KBG23_01695 [Candidatus Dojkabacteria bacterium]|jgi:hypothetical protein|nr:hypothetical protein [Candidatus Dojkabacteria bacterium]
MTEDKELNELNINYILPSTEVKGDDGIDYSVYVHDFTKYTNKYTDVPFGYAPVLDEENISLFQIVAAGDKNNPENAEKLSKLPFGEESFLKHFIGLGKELRRHVQSDMEKGEMQKWSIPFEFEGENYTMTYLPDIEGPINPYKNYLKRLSTRK